jgi:hypothetical protein
MSEVGLALVEGRWRHGASRTVEELVPEGGAPDLRTWPESAP